MKIILFLGVFIVFSKISAQFYNADTWYYSFAVGGVASYLSHQYTFNSEEFNTKMKTNFSAGGNIHYRATGVISLSAGLYFLRAGGNYSTERFNAPAFRYFTMTYFQTPFGISYQADRWMFEAGGYASYLLASRVSIHRDEMLGSTSMNLYNDTNPVDGGLYGGAGYGFQLESNAIFSVGLRYYQGLSDVFAPNFARQEDTYKTTLHQVFFIYLQATYGF